VLLLLLELPLGLDPRLVPSFSSESVTPGMSESEWRWLSSVEQLKRRHLSLQSSREVVASHLLPLGYTLVLIVQEFTFHPLLRFSFVHRKIECKPNITVEGAVYLIRAMLSGRPCSVKRSGCHHHQPYTIVNARARNSLYTRYQRYLFSLSVVWDRCKHCQDHEGGTECLVAGPSRRCCIDSFERVHDKGNVLEFLVEASPPGNHCFRKEASRAVI
jgi:hypothetical protein